MERGQISTGSFPTSVSRVQFFAWLLVQERVQSREHLKRRHVLTDAICEVCNSGEETATHRVPLPLCNLLLGHNPS